MSELPSRFTVRRPTLVDAEGILAVGIARDVADIGYPDYALEDVREEVTEPGLDLERDGWVVCESDGRVVASALITGGDARVAVHPDACGVGIGTYLREAVERRARQRGEPVVRQQVSGSNDAARTLLEAAGYSAVQRYWRMVRELGAELPVVPWPDGVEARDFAAADERAAYEVVREAFTDIPGNVERPFEEWRSMALGNAQFDSGLSTVARAGGDPAGVVVCHRWEGGQGYVAYLAVARAWRGRGLGRAVLADAFEKMRAAGLEKAALNVNGSNESASRLYTGVGMRIDSRAERHDKRLD